MSSFITHALVGATVASTRRKTAIHPGRLGCVLALLAILPDFDYLPLWLLDFRPSVRFTHSLLFAVGSASTAWLLCRRWTGESNWLCYLVAAVSHPLLDLLVGVHPVPLLWPLPHPEVSIPIGILPSAGRLQLDNFYLWRNLCIELSLMGPPCALIMLRSEEPLSSTVRRTVLLLLPLWVLILWWSISLHL